MKLIENLDRKKFDKFVQEHPTKSHFLQTSAWGEFARKQKNVIPHYVGLEDKKQLVACALLLEKKLPFGYSYYYSPRGFVIDFNNTPLLEEFTKLLKQHMKKNKVIFTKIDPDIKLQDRTKKGDPIKDHPNNFALVKKLQKLGYHHLGFNENFEHNEPRYTFRLNIKDKSVDEIIQNMHPTTKNILKRKNPFELSIIKGTKKNIDDFCLTMRETEKRQNTLFCNDEYYKTFYEDLHAQNMSELFLVKVNIKKLKSIYQEKITELQDKIEKTTKKKQDLIDQLHKLEKEQKQLNQIKEKELPLSSMLTVTYNNKVWTVHGGNHHLLRELNANYLVYFEIIKDAIEKKYEVVDFFGTAGNPDKSNPVYGIHLFKKRLGGEYMEFIGEFDLIGNHFLYLCFRVLIPMRHKLQRIINKRKKRRKS